MRLSRHRIRLADGHVVSALVAGRGVPLVVVHGFSAEGLLYAQSLSRLVSMGFKVVAIDTAGHGGTAVLPRDGLELAAYGRLLGRAVDELGIRRAVFAGHSMGGRLVTELAASDAWLAGTPRTPGRAIAVLLLDAIVGDTWDGIVSACRFWPPLLGMFAGVAVLDTFTTLALNDTTQMAKLARLWGGTAWGDLTRPWQLLGPFISVLRSPASRPMLERLAEAGVPVVVIHGERDLVVPLATARDTARRSGGDLVVVKGAGHSWLLSDPETFPRIVGELLRGRLGDAYEQALVDAGLEPGSATVDEIEDALYAPDAPVRALTPELDYLRSERRRDPRYRWEVRSAS